MDFIYETEKGPTYKQYNQNRSQDQRLQVLPVQPSTGGTSWQHKKPGQEALLMHVCGVSEAQDGAQAPACSQQLCPWLRVT